MSGLDLKIARIRAGVKQIDLSAETRIPQPRLSLIENGRVRPSKDELRAISAGLEECGKPKAIRRRFFDGR